jgi:hypothetical protein
MRREQVIKDDYEKRVVEERDNTCGSPHVLRVFAHKGMGELPEELIAHFRSEMLIVNEFTRHWATGNPDYGTWDAYTVQHYHGQYYDVYVCGIIVRPWTEEEQDAYEAAYMSSDVRGGGISISKRLQSFYDNRTTQL